MIAIAKETMQFLQDLRENNNREWFQENKARYETAKANFEEFVDGLLKEMAVFDPTIEHLKAKDCIFRIYRDVRFGKDKSPYKTHFGAHISAATKKSEIHQRSGYYLHISPNESILGGGAYLPESDWLKKIRQEIDYNGQKLVSIINDKEFVNVFGRLEGEALKRPPKGYDESHEFIDLLKQKSFLARKELSMAEVTTKDFLHQATKVFKTLKPLGDFLNESLENA